MRIMKYLITLTTITFSEVIDVTLFKWKDQCLVSPDLTVLLHVEDAPHRLYNKGQ